MTRQGTKARPAGRAFVASFSTLVLLAGCGLFGGGDSTEQGGDPKDSGTAAIGWESAPRVDVAAGGTLRLAVSELPGSFNVFHERAVGSEATTLMAPTAGHAVRLTADGGWEADPLYADEVEITDRDPFTVRVVISGEARWSTGEPVRAADMIAFADRVGNRGGWSHIDEVVPEGDGRAYTVRFDRAVADWPALVYPGLSERDSTGDRFNGFARRSPDSLGPFVVDAIDRDAGTVTMVRNPHWWGTEPRLERIEWRAAALGAQTELFVGGELDAVRVDGSTYSAIDDDRVQRAAGTEWSHLTLNAGAGPLRSEAVRRAVALALDRTAIAEATAEATESQAVTQGSVVLMPGQSGYHDTVGQQVEHDPVAARKVLREAEFTFAEGKALDADGDPLTLRLPIPADTPSIAERATLVTRDLAKVGITVEVSEVAADRFFADAVVPLDFDLVTFRWSGGPFAVEAAEERLYPVDSPQNFTGQGPDAVHDAWQKAARAVDPERLAEAVRVIDEAVVESGAMIPLAVEPSVMAVAEGLVNYGASQFVQPDWTKVGFLK